MKVLRMIVCEVSWSCRNERFSKWYLSLQSSIRVIAEWFWWAGRGAAMDCGWDAPAVALAEAHVGPQVMQIPSVSLLKNVCPLLDEGFMCKTWCFRGWVVLVVRVLFHPAPAWPTCSTGWTTVCWNVLKFVKFITQKSRSHNQSKGLFQVYSIFLSNFPHETNLASSFGLATIFITMSFLLIFFYCYLMFRFSIYLLIVSE